MGRKVSEDREMIEAVRATVYSAFSLILSELAATDEEAAHEWLRLTAQGMRITRHSLALNLYEYNCEKFERTFGDAPDD